VNIWKWLRIRCFRGETSIYGMALKNGRTDLGSEINENHQKEKENGG